MMINDDKARLYEAILREGDKISREISKLKSQNAGINLSEETEKQIKQLQARQTQLENQLLQLVKNI